MLLAVCYKLRSLQEGGQLDLIDGRLDSGSCHELFQMRYAKVADLNCAKRHLLQT